MKKNFKILPLKKMVISKLNRHTVEGIKGGIETGTNKRCTWKSK